MFHFSADAAKLNPRLLCTQVAKRDEAILSLQSELDATQQEYITCSTELTERETEVTEMKAKIGDLELKLKELRVQQKSDEDKVNIVKRSSKGYSVFLKLRTGSWKLMYL